MEPPSMSIDCLSSASFFDPLVISDLNAEIERVLGFLPPSHGSMNEMLYD